MSKYKRSLNDLLLISTLKTAQFSPKELKMSHLLFTAIFYNENPVLILGSYKNKKTVEAAKKLVHDKTFKKIMGFSESSELLYGAVGGNTINWAQCSSAIVKRAETNFENSADKDVEIIAMMAGQNAQKPLSLLCVYDGFSSLFDSSCSGLYDEQDIQKLI